jgi:hypothetical protein
MTLQIRIRTNKNGKRVAHYYGSARRWLPLPVVEAEIALATKTLFGRRAVSYYEENTP